ncbi:hypothetical protein THOM_1844 [Trachipleistophora hominis]|uniref:Uncharacterized protein n=1 Tax=Trachipleistophora hominis TaxID=72359 RepID=L7JW18_TRAHO|nr:hypothetical protein THOM_1844 [Trachipleistophora hominis]
MMIRKVQVTVIVGLVTRKFRNVDIDRLILCRHQLMARLEVWYNSLLGIT